MTNEKPFVDKGFAPIVEKVPPGLSPVTSSPTISKIDLPEDEPYVLSVGQPTMLKVLRFVGTLPAAGRVRFNPYWQPLGQPSDDVFDIGGSRQIEFLGPYAYLPAPGLYRIVPNAGGASMGATPLRFRIEVRQGVTPAEFLAYVSNRAWQTTGGPNTLAAGVEEHLLTTQAEEFPQILSFKVRNTGANPVDIIVGQSATWTLAIGTEIEFQPWMVSMSTVKLLSTLGTTVQTMVGFC